MKRVAGLLFLLAAAGAGIALHRNQPPSAARATSVAAVGSDSSRQLVLGVETLMNSVDDHRGLVVVEGVVKSSSTETKLVELIDREEFRACGTTTCARLTLPVRWSGRAPSPGATVRAAGHVGEDAGKLVFVAATLEVKEEAK